MRLTFYISIVIQFITGIVTFGGIFYKLPKQDRVLKDILAFARVSGALCLERIAEKPG